MWSMLARQQERMHVERARAPGFAGPSPLVLSMQVVQRTESTVSRVLQGISALQAKDGTTVDDVYDIVAMQGLAGASQAALPLAAVLALLQHLSPSASRDELATVALLLDVQQTGRVSRAQLLEAVLTARMVRLPPDNLQQLLASTAILWLQRMRCKCTALDGIHCKCVASGSAAERLLCTASLWRDLQ
jgi:hypothetical protein